MKPTNRFLHRGGVAEERDPIAVLDNLISIGHMGILAAANLGDQTTTRNLVGEIPDRFLGDMLGGDLDLKNIVAVAEIVHPAGQRCSFDLAVSGYDPMKMRTN